MKICPACKTQYSDDTLKYCLQDGTLLEVGAESDMPTVALDEAETIAARTGQNRVNVPVSDTDLPSWQQSQVTRIGTPAPPTRRSNASVIVIAAVVLVFVLLSIAALVVTFLRNFPGPVATNNANFSTPVSNSNYGSYQAPPSSPFATPTTTRPAATPSSSGTVDAMPAGKDKRTKGEISQRVYGWKSSLESHDFNGYMNNYAPTVDYYNRRGVSSVTIRADKARAFSLYNSMRVNVSNMSVSVDPSGDTATAVFDKEWVFAGDGRSEGKTRSQLDFRRINGRWLITAERDLKLYYKR